MVGLADCSTCVNISGIIPVVPIVPDLLLDIHRQYQSYGGWTWAFQDYVDSGLMQTIDDGSFTSMMDIVDPINYLDRLAKVPKFVIVSSNDEFMMFDWTSIYYDQIYGEFGENRLLIIPNSDHGLSTGMHDLLSTSSTFMRSIAEGKTERPSFEYTHDDGVITVTIPQDGPKPKSVMLRHAETFSSTKRDFRWTVLGSEDNNYCSSPWTSMAGDHHLVSKLKSKFNWGGDKALSDDPQFCSQNIKWEYTTLQESDDGVYVGTAPDPKVDGHWVGYYVEVIFPGDTDAPFHPLYKNEFILSTPGWVLPDTLPFKDCDSSSILNKCSNDLV